MLSSRTMGSQGHQNLPFGCTDGNLEFHGYQTLIGADDHNNIHGIGLPAYINQPHPPGQPLLSEQENEGLQDFFSAFDAEGQNQPHQNVPSHFHDNMAQLHSLQMPQTYVGHETYVRSPHSMDWQSQHMTNFQFGHQMHPMSAMQMQTPTSPYTNGHVTSPNTMVPMNQHHMPGFSNSWQQNFPSNSLHGTRQEMSFGTDPNFLQSGYAAPEGSVDPDTSILQYAMAPISSASNTQPNSRPSSNANTEPSSPVVTKAVKRRRVNAFQSENLRMTSGKDSSSNGVATKESPPASRRRKSFVKHEQLPTPLSKTPTVDEDEVLEEDAEYDDDAADDLSQAVSPSAPWPANKARPTPRPSLSSRPSKARKKSQSIASPVKPKPRRASSSTTAISRIPLTAEQKKANHTNSEQRRRDATARAYAELYDMVPELEELGKQSTMKKLEVVVDKVRNVKQRLQYLQNILGQNAGGSMPTQIPTNQYINDISHMSGWH